MDAALQAHLGGTAVDRLDDAPLDLLEVEEIRIAAEVERERALRERAEPALEGADVRVVDVARAHERDDVAHDVAPELVGDLGDPVELRAAGFEQRDDLVDADFLAGEHALENLTDGRAGARGEWQPCGSSDGGDTSPPAAQSSSRANPSESDAQSTANRTSGSSQRSASRTYSGYTVSRGASVLPIASVATRKRVERRPRSFRIHVVGSDRRHAAPVVDARGDERAELVGVGEVRWCLEVHVRAEHDARGGDGPEELVAIARVVPPHRGARLGQEVLDDHLLHVPVTLVRVADREQRVEPLGARLADPDEDAGGERDRGASRGLERGQPALGGLVGRARVRAAGLPEASRERLDHHSLRRRHRPQAFELRLRERPGIGVGEEPGLLEHRRARGHEVVDGRRVAVGGEPVGGHRVAVLGRLAEREERFVAADRGAPARDVEHVVDREVRSLEVCGRLGERAVTAAVAAQHRERDEHLRREGDAGSVGGIAQARGFRHEVGQRRVEQRRGVHGACHRAQPRSNRANDREPGTSTHSARTRAGMRHERAERASARQERTARAGYPGSQ